MDYSSESVEQRLARREARWSPVAVVSAWLFARPGRWGGVRNYHAVRGSGRWQRSRPYCFLQAAHRHSGTPARAPIRRCLNIRSSGPRRSGAHAVGS